MRSVPPGPRQRRKIFREKLSPAADLESGFFFFLCRWTPRVCGFRRAEKCLSPPNNPWPPGPDCPLSGPNALPRLMRGRLGPPFFCWAPPGVFFDDPLAFRQGRPVAPFRGLPNRLGLAETSRVNPGSGSWSPRPPRSESIVGVGPPRPALFQPPESGRERTPLPRCPSGPRWDYVPPVSSLKNAGRMFFAFSRGEFCPVERGPSCRVGCSIHPVPPRNGPHRPPPVFWFCKSCGGPPGPRGPDPVLSPAPPTEICPPANRSRLFSAKPILLSPTGPRQRCGGGSRWGRRPIPDCSGET